jgi:membrane-associated phospholipid phosphatase
MKSIASAVAMVALSIVHGSVAAQPECKKDPVGDTLQFALPAAALGVSAWHDMDTEGMWQFGQSIVVAQGVTGALKYSIHTTRPCGGQHSFPSGHTTSAFAASAYVQQRYGTAESAPFYLLATMTGYQRVRTNHHRVGDIVGGAVIGISSSWFLSSPGSDKNFRLTVVPNGRQTFAMLEKAW